MNNADVDWSRVREIYWDTEDGEYEQKVETPEGARLLARELAGDPRVLTVMLADEKGSGFHQYKKSI